MMSCTYYDKFLNYYAYKQRMNLTGLSLAVHC